MSGRGRVRFELLLGQVLDALPQPPASVVDAGGGTGQLAVPLARLGYHVTVVDTSAAMLATCSQRAAAEVPAHHARLPTARSPRPSSTSVSPRPASRWPDRTG